MSATGIRHVVMRLAMSDPDLERDAEDGRALRELREALPDGWGIVTQWGTELVGQEWSVIVRNARRLPDGTLDPDYGGPWVVRYARTIADAADECRKVLEARP